MEYAYIVDESVPEPIMLVDKHIGFDAEMEAISPGSGEGIMGDKFQKSLLYLDSLGKKSIQVRICSEGGGVLDAMKIYSAILMSKTPVNTYVNGVAASSGAIIYMAGAKRTMCDYGQLMFHNPSGGGDEDTALKPIKDSIVKMIATRCGKTEDEVSAMMNRTTWIDADEALGIFCDSIEDSGVLNTIKNELLTTKLHFARSLINNAYSKTNNMTTAEKLGLPKTATEAEILNRIEEIANENKTLKTVKDSLKAKETELKKLKDEMEPNETEDSMKEKKAKEKKALEDKLAETEKMCNELKAKMDGLTEKTNKVELTEKVSKATAMVNKYTNRIGNKAETVKMWVDQATTDFENTEKMLSELPLKALNVTGVENKAQYKEGETPIDAANPNAYFAQMNAKKQIEVKNRVKI